MGRAEAAGRIVALRPAALPSKDGECYLMTVTRLITLLILFALVVTNGPAVAMAKCQHEDARAHAAALQSTEARERTVAVGEEAAKAASEKASLGDAATTLLGGYILPGDALQFPSRVIEATTRHVDKTSPPGTRNVPPLLEPPLA